MKSAIMLQIDIIVPVGKIMLSNSRLREKNTYQNTHIEHNRKIDRNVKNIDIFL